MNAMPDADSPSKDFTAESMHPEVPLIAHARRQQAARRVAPSVDPRPPQDPSVARSWVGLPCVPTIVATGPFDDISHAVQLADAFAAVRQRYTAQLVLLGTGPQRTALVRRTFTHGDGAGVHVPRVFPKGRWSDIVAAADVVIPSTTSGPDHLLQVLAIGRPVVAPVDPATVRLVVPNSAGFVYRPGDVSGMAAALLRLLTSPGLRHEMSCRAEETGRRHFLEQRLRQHYGGNGYA